VNLHEKRKPSRRLGKFGEVYGGFHDRSGVHFVEKFRVGGSGGGRIVVQFGIVRMPGQQRE
jgi:hypothetical protein